MKEDHHDARRRRHTPEQVVRKLREADRLLGEGADIAALARHLEMPGRPSTGGANQYGGMTADGTKRLKEVERGDCALKRIVADQEVEIAALKEMARGR